MTKKPIVKTTPRRLRSTARERKITSPPASRQELKVSPSTPPPYLFAVGRRKEAVARIRWYHQGPTDFVINGRPMAEYFPVAADQQLITAPLRTCQRSLAERVQIKVSGGGTQGQAEAIRLGLARVLVKVDPDYRLALKRAGFLRRDPRVKERKKYGLKRARRAPQWQKR
ncbi:MAG: 30S ribosomal protein S9 [Candidatus Kerfeldbacteria bacterium]|nr:30S ribosomal protein S9 [Candidatus Kerfeldbacteria bacterium]